ncbi:pentapeptide repeat-containing protein [Nocardia tengchongensis]|uniref:pentapeptide repeat-containing protein n=1 Tax=Nocardia tengchongensis TaxID=2055889 RepID=UPI0033D2A0EF
MTTTIAAIAALWFTSQSLRATSNQYDLSQQVAATDRFQKAVAALTSDMIDIRLGGIYLLERLAKDSPTDRDTVFAVLSAFLRTHTNATACETPTRTAPAPVDISAVVAVIRRREHRGPLDLARTCLSGMGFRQANLAGSSFDSASLSETLFYSADLTHAWFNGATLVNAGFSFANLTDAQLGNADLRGTFLDSTNLTNVWFGNTNLASAYCANADFTKASLINANLTSANLAGANLADAVLDHVDLTNIYYDRATRWPPGYTPPASRPTP